MTEPWWKSKTKRGGLLIGVGAILTTVGMVETGKIDIIHALPLIIAEIGAIWTIFGYRNALDKKK